MKIFSFKVYMYLAYILGIAFSLIIALITANQIKMILLLISAFIGLLSLINKIFTYYQIDDKRLQQKSLFKTQYIDLGNILFVTMMPASKGRRVFIGVYSDSQKIFLSFWIKNYKELLKEIISRCKNNKNLKIDKSIMDIIE